METSNKHNQNEYSYLRRLPSDKLRELLALAPSLSDKRRSSKKKKKIPQDFSPM